MSGRFFYTVEQIDAMLISRMESLARHLAPDGEKSGCEWTARNPARVDKKRGSFSINIATGVWKDFAAGQGARTLPGLALVAYLATAGDFKAAIVWAKDWLGLTDRAPDPAVAAKAEAQMKRAREDDDKEREARRRAAFEIFLASRPLNGEDPASEYLAARGLDVTRMAGGRAPRSLRYHQGITHRAEPGKHPALIACMSVEGAPNGFGGIHRIYLAQVRGVWSKAFGGRQAKVALGYQTGASVRVSNGASGKKLADAPAGEWAMVTEGIEDGLALALAMPEARVLATYSLSAIGLVVLPPQIGGVTIVADNDPADSDAARALQRVTENLADRVAVKLARMPAAFKDVNDALIGKRRDAGRRNADKINAARRARRDVVPPGLMSLYKKLRRCGLTRIEALAECWRNYAGAAE